MKTAPFLGLLPAVAVLAGGCSSAGLQDTDALQQAMHLDHKAAVSVLKKINTVDQPYRVEDGVTRSTFCADDLYLVAPADVAAWDKILGALDDYCAALDCLASQKASSDFTTASEGLGAKVNTLAKAGGIATGADLSAAETAVIELGSLVLQCKAQSDARSLAVKANPSFQSVIGALIEALGFEGDPPVPSSHGLLATFESEFSAGTAAEAKRFKGGTIGGFASLGPEQKRESIKELQAWLKVQQGHDDFVSTLKTLVAALDKVRRAHAALCGGDAEKASAAFAQLQADIKNVKDIYDDMKQG
jgi:hypothetical protein